MSVEDIGELVPTKVPGYSDSADIQAALRAYHYGSYDFDINETDPANLINPSVAYTINNLQDQINEVDAIPSTVLTGKGSLISASSASTVSTLTVGSNGQVLTANSGTTSGLQWTSPEVTSTNAATLSGKTLTAPKFADLGYIADANGNELIVMDTVTSAVNEIKVSNAATGGKPSITAQGGDTDVSLNLVAKGAGEIQSNGVKVATNDEILLTLAGGL
jgi:hypothetical protein